MRMAGQFSPRWPAPLGLCADIWRVTKTCLNWVAGARARLLHRWSVAICACCAQWLHVLRAWTWTYLQKQAGVICLDRANAIWRRTSEGCIESANYYGEGTALWKRCISKDSNDNQFPQQIYVRLVEIPVGPTLAAIEVAVAVAAPDQSAASSIRPVVHHAQV